MPAGQSLQSENDVEPFLLEKPDGHVVQSWLADFELYVPGLQTTHLGLLRLREYSYGAGFVPGPHLRQMMAPRRDARPFGHGLQDTAPGVSE